MKVVLNFDFFSLLMRQNCMFIPLLFPAILSKIDKVRPRLRMISTKWLFISLPHAVLQLCGDLFSCFAQSRLQSTFWSHLAVSVILESRFFRLKVLQSTCFELGGSKMCNLFLLSAQIYSLYSTTWGCDYTFFTLKTIMSWLSTKFGLTTENRNSCR